MSAHPPGCLYLVVLLAMAATFAAAGRFFRKTLEWSPFPSVVAGLGVAVLAAVALILAVGLLVGFGNFVDRVSERRAGRERDETDR